MRRWDGVGRDGSKRMVKGRSKRRRGQGKGQAWQGVGWDVKKNIMVCVVGLRERQDAGEFGFGVCVVSSLIPTLVNSCSLETRA